MSSQVQSAGCPNCGARVVGEDSTHNVGGHATVLIRERQYHCENCDTEFVVRPRKRVGEQVRILDAAHYPGLPAGGRL